MPPLVDGALETGTAPFVDTHAHLDDSAFDGDREVVIDRAVKAGVAMVVNIGYRPSRWTTTSALAATSPRVAAVLGLHPQHADEFTPTICNDLARYIAEAGACAVGEIGLDYFRSGPPPSVQRHAFEQQLLMAERLSLPVVIHQRAAEEDCLAILKDAPSSLRVVLHSFEGSERLAAWGLDHGHFFGVGGLMTRAGSNHLRSILANLPLERLILETDAPYLVPARIKERRNVPANIPVIARHLAELRGTDIESIASATTRNAAAAFGLHIPPLPHPTDERNQDTLR